MKSKRRQPLRMGVVGALVAMLAMAVGASAALGYSEFKTTSKFPITVTGYRAPGTGPVTLQGTSGNSISCEDSTMKGSLESPTRLKATVTFSGKCEANGTVRFSCPAITSRELTAEPGENLAGPVVGTTTKDGVIFRPTSGEVIAEYTCDGSQFKFTGGFICETAVIGELYPENEAVCKQTSAGEQEFTSIEIGGKTIAGRLKFESTLLFFKPGESDALSMTQFLEFTKEGMPVEVEQSA